jgi:N-acetyl-anhydromuramyl-L-alanine amidase AmpD
MEIDRSLRLPDDQFYRDALPKRQIHLHHTVGGSAKSTYWWWLKDPKRIGCAYIIERGGLIYEVFDPQYWCHHLGLKTPDNRSANELSIGIELASEGALTKKGDLLYCFDGMRIFSGESVELPQEWRDYKYFDAYDEGQIISCIALVNYLCDRFCITKATINGDKNRFDLSLLKFSGVLSHCNVREDKTDVHPLFPFNRLFNEELL